MIKVLFRLKFLLSFLVLNLLMQEAYSQEFLGGLYQPIVVNQLADVRNSYLQSTSHREDNIDKRWLFLGAYEWAVFSSLPIVIISRKVGAPKPIVIFAGVAGGIGGSIYGYNWAKNVMMGNKGWWGRWEEPGLGIFSCAVLATMILITTGTLMYAEF